MSKNVRSLSDDSNLLEIQTFSCRSFTGKSLTKPIFLKRKFGPNFPEGPKPVEIGRKIPKILEKKDPYPSKNLNYRHFTGSWIFLLMRYGSPIIHHLWPRETQNPRGTILRRMTPLPPPRPTHSTARSRLNRPFRSPLLRPPKVFGAAVAVLWANLAPLSPFSFFFSAVLHFLAKWPRAKIVVPGGAELPHPPAIDDDEDGAAAFISSAAADER